MTWMLGELLLQKGLKWLLHRYCFLLTTALMWEALLSLPHINQPVHQYAYDLQDAGINAPSPLSTIWDTTSDHDDHDETVEELDFSHGIISIVVPVYIPVQCSV